MNLSLWRGDRELGKIHAQEPPTDSKLVGVLVPCVGVEALGGVMQTQFLLGSSRPVFQHPLALLSLADGFTSARAANPGPVLLARLSEEEAQGVPLDLQLSIRDGEGRIVYPTSILTLQAVQRPAHRMAQDELELPAGALVNGCLWMVLAIFDLSIAQ